jgi:UDP-glucose 4-epimerase
MKKMLIVGGAGYLGGYMTDVFEARDDYDITVYDNLLYETRYMKNVNFIAEQQGSRDPTAIFDCYVG